MLALSELFQDIADAIRSKTGNSGKMKPIDFPNEILNIEAGGSVDSNLVKYVTFMSEDGTSELFEMPVLNGDDCKDPVTHGDIEKPTKESSNTENFVYSGWSLRSYGSADTAALKSVTDDRVVYSAFAGSVRYYTVNFYSETGVLHESVQVTYGGTATPTAMPEKAGHYVSGWMPSNENITADTDCYAVWEKETVLKLADYTWAELASMSASGQAGNFQIGDTKEIYTTQANANYKTTAQLIGINHDTLENGNKVGMTFRLLGATNSSGVKDSGGFASYSTTNGKKYGFNESTLYQIDESNSFTRSMQKANGFTIKPVLKKYYCPVAKEVLEISTHLWPESLSEMGINSGYNEGDCYPIYTSNKSLDGSHAELVRHNWAGDTAVVWWTRSTFKESYKSDWYGVDATGKPTIYQQTEAYVVYFCFCI